jgi:hypothetical protein
LLVRLTGTACGKPQVAEPWSEAIRSLTLIVAAHRRKDHVVRGVDDEFIQIGDEGAKFLVSVDAVVQGLTAHVEFRRSQRDTPVSLLEVEPTEAFTSPDRVMGSQLGLSDALTHGGSEAKSSNQEKTRNARISSLHRPRLHHGTLNFADHSPNGSVFPSAFVQGIAHGKRIIYATPDERLHRRDYVIGVWGRCPIIARE